MQDPPGETDPPPLKDETKLGVVGRKPFAYSGFVNMPVFRGSTVLFPDAERFQSREVEFTYGRPSTPTSRALAEAIAALEGGARTCVTPSGLNAITTTLLAFASPKAHFLIVDSAYGPTRRFAERMLRALGVEVEYYDPSIGAEIKHLFRPETKLIWTESPGSLSFEVQDIPAIACQANQAGIILAIDNTWATPLFFKPLNHGVNIVVHSATKYIVGHADALLGLITCDDKTASHLALTHEALGLCASSDDCFLALRGLRTLAVRLAHHQRAGLDMARWLQERSEIQQVLHPGLPGAPGHGLWQRDFTGASGLFSIVLHPSFSNAQVNAMLNSLKLFGMGYSWGGYESLIIPFDVKPVRTATSWPYSGPCLRLHIGLEAVEDLKADLDQGFAHLKI